MDVSGFNTSQVTAMQSMFNYCSKLTVLDVSNFDTGKVTSMAFMFNQCNKVALLDVSNFNTSNVTSMASMFNGCENVKTLDVSDFDTSKVTDMSTMFSSCIGVTILNLRNFNTNKVTNMSRMFSYWTNGMKLTKIYVSEFNTETNTGWTTSAVTNSANMFLGCSNIQGGNGTTFDASHIDITYARIDTPETPGYFTDIADKPVT